MSINQSDAAAAAAPPFLGIRAIGVTVADISATQEFYGRDLPFTEVGRFQLPANAFGQDLVRSQTGTAEIVLVDVASTMVQLMRFSDAPRTAKPPAVNGPGYTHICWQSPATDPALHKLIDAGLTLVSRCGRDGVDLGGYGIRYAYGRDPEQRMIEVEILDKPHRGDAAWVAHLANVTHDHPAMLDFYARLLGRPCHRLIRDGGGRKTHDDVTGFDDVRYHGGWFHAGNLDIELWQFVHPPTPAPVGRRLLDQIGYNAPIFEVADIDAETRRLAGLGIPLVGPRLDLGGAMTQYASDPDGNLFAVQQLSDMAVGGSVSRYL